MLTANDLRDAIRGVVVLADRDLQVVWSRVRTADMARRALEETLPLLVDAYGTAAGAVAADWYDEHRDDLDVPGLYRAAPSVADDGADVLARWGLSPLFQENQDWDLARTLIAGGLQRRIADVARNTVAGSTLTDPQADGWQRTGTGECAFCSMLIGRGAVYTKKTVRFASHDNCNCSAVPAFGGRPRPVKSYTPSSRKSSDADRRRVREYLAANPAG